MEVFKALWAEARRSGSSAHRNAVCVCTLDADGYPNPRFVDLKQADERGFVFCTHLDSAKAGDIARNPKTGIAMWWEHVATQVRIKGTCTALSAQEADQHWAGRPRDAQLAASAFRQSHPLADVAMLAAEHSRAKSGAEGKAIARPASWGGFRLLPEHVEFLEFKENRLHVRTAYALVENRWRKSLLQP
ncbi:pyridoxine/pyridoxamine 5'-phosphate oxidase [Luteimonas salinisoli]|nr:pyridoxal 5'-phosphate synthase [Luteimonas salinisoli]